MQRLIGRRNDAHHVSCVDGKRIELHFACGFPRAKKIAAGVISIVRGIEHAAALEQQPHVRRSESVIIGTRCQSALDSIKRGMSFIKVLLQPLCAGDLRLQFKRIGRSRLLSNILQRFSEAKFRASGIIEIPKFSDRHERDLFETVQPTHAAGSSNPARTLPCHDENGGDRGGRYR